MNVCKRLSCRWWFEMSLDECSVIDAGKVVQSSWSTGRARRPCLALCKTVSWLAILVFWRVSHSRSLMRAVILLVLLYICVGSESRCSFLGSFQFCLWAPFGWGSKQYLNILGEVWPMPCTCRCSTATSSTPTSSKPVGPFPLRPL